MGYYALGIFAKIGHVNDYRAARKRYHAIRNHIIRIQACVRRRQAKKLLIALRAEARSASHLKEVSYKLENKVVELTQSLTQQKEEKAALRSQVTQLQAQVQSWMEKYEKLEKKAKQVEAGLGESSRSAQAELELLKQTHEALKKDYQESLAKIESQEKEIAKLNKEVTSLRQRSAASPPLTVATNGKPGTDSDIAELKNQIAALKAQLSQSLKNPPRRQNSLHAYARNLSPVRSPGGGNRRAVSPDGGTSPRGRSPTGANATSFRRNSIAESTNNKQETQANGGMVYAEPEQIRPMSIDNVKALREAETNGNPEEAVRTS